MSDTNDHHPKSYADLHQRIIGKANVMHSNIYAQEAHGERIGSTSHETFGQRQDIHNNRQTVRSYRESVIGASYSIPHIESTVRNRSVMTPPRPVIPQTQTGMRRTFQEPTTRAFNPYG